MAEHLAEVVQKTAYCIFDAEVPIVCHWGTTG